MGDAISPHTTPSEWLKPRIERLMSDFTSESAESPDYHPSRFLPSIGELLVSLCSQAATALADGGHIERCAAQISEREKKETDLSELELIQHFGKQHSSLRKAAAVVCSAAERARAVWRDDPELLQLSWPLQSPLARSLPPKAEAQIEVGFSPAALEIMPDPSWRDGYAAQLDEDPGKGNEWVEAPTSEDDIYSKVQDLLATLSSRGKGKGQYTCPYGVACPRDGVDSNGHIRIFERNSDFRTHLAKHERKYKCPQAGCRNRAGFARKDQLRRHQRTVPHSGQ